MKAIFTDPEGSSRLTFRETEVPVPASNQALVKVHAFTLNQGETRTAFSTTDSYIPGWDFAGEIVRAAADGSSLKEGTRVFGFIPRGSWAEYVVAPAVLMAEMPIGLSYSQAATLPVAGLTAMACIEESGSLLDRRVLITGAAGGVGRFLCSLAALAGARISAVSRRRELSAQLRSDSIEPAGVFTTINEAKAAGQYDVIFDSIGGDTLADAILALAPDGLCLNYGNSARQPTSFDVRGAGWLWQRKRIIFLGREVPANCTPVLSRVAALAEGNLLRLPIDAELPWTEIVAAADRLLQGLVDGKIVLTVS